jgi:hypothetical protein
MAASGEAKRAWGGSRAGSGRKSKNRCALPDIDIAHALAEPAPEDIEAAARRHAVMAIGTMVKIVKNGESEGAAIRAANAILDRGYGKPAVEIDALVEEIRAEARRYANLAIERLRLIADAGRSENSRASAAKSLLDRGLGAVAVAQFGGEDQRKVGKKEAAEIAAETAGEGTEWGDDLRWNRS